MKKFIMPFFLFLPALIFSSSLSQNSNHKKLIITETTPVILTIVDEPIVLAQFSTDKTTGEAPLLVTFTNLSENATAYVWDFGDGDTSSFANPNHIYTEEGTFTVSLVASNENGSDTENKTSYIIVTQAVVLEAIFTADTTEGEFPLEITFTNNSTNATGFNWSFGDGETSSEISPKHTFTRVGDYTVSLIASNADFADTLIKANYISVKWPAPIANFSATPVYGINPLTVIFTDNSENAQTWLWDFGDGSPNSLEQNPTHIYPDGVFSVSLLITNPSTNDFLMKQNFINVNPNGLAEKLKSDLKIFPNPVTENATIEFINENFTSVEIEIIDMLGRIVKTENPILSTLIKHELKVKDLESGNYIIKIRIDGEQMGLKFIKK